ncbi:hypothetical protein [Pectobacterium phage PPWS1]|uniref:Uncharacterized protein n=1 Tax=Pectobacterium phage PPWS1 TaxID=1685500 RepID=A0A0P0UW62_9CAUD|nr:hypothetical protein HOR09_gp25 [Pectobacterium phage PPWS1]BAS69540.1 hypothetical protein [Pectobacterium phage PPWS1]
MITDAFGNPVTIGDVVAIGRGREGAQPLLVGTVLKVGPKTISVEVVTFPRHYRTREPVRTVNVYQRPAGSFVVQS